MNEPVNRKERVADLKRGRHQESVGEGEIRHRLRREGGISRDYSILGETACHERTVRTYGEYVA